MFTGIIEEIGVIKNTSPRQLHIEAKKVLADTKPGDSIAVNGVCLTVTSLHDKGFSVDIMPETIRRSNLGRLRYGDMVNLERAISANGRFGGHFVQGHVDGTGSIISLLAEDRAVVAKILTPAELMPYIVNKGFIAVDGVSLTVISCDDFSFSVSLVTYTREHTTLGRKKPGDVVNLEVDIIAKYVERLVSGEKPGITLDFLVKHDFLKMR